MTNKEVHGKEGNNMDNLTNFEKAIIVHALFKYAEYLRTMDYPFPSIFKPEGIENLAFKINDMKGDNNG